jgi:hypothetical protein
MINNYKNAKQKVLITNAAIGFNNICGIDHLAPNYIQIEIKGINQQAKNMRLAKL